MEKIRELITYECYTKYKFLSGEENRITFIGDDKTLIIFEASHLSDCCEHNYMDGDNLKETSITSIHSNILELEFVGGYGIRINGHGIPCYSSQNGYYSDDIDIEIKKVYTNGYIGTILKTNLTCKPDFFY